MNETNEAETRPISGIGCDNSERDFFEIPCPRLGSILNPFGNMGRTLAENGPGQTPETNAVF
jgi:hypothetical protein